MCDACITDIVKSSMLSRRHFFAGAAALGASAAVATHSPALAQGTGRVVDLTHALHPAFPTYFGAPQFAMDQVFRQAQDGFNLFNLALGEHVGTHVDAPLHFSADGQSVDEIPVDSLVAPLCVIDIAARAADNPDTQVTTDDLKAWTATHGEIPDNACVAMQSGWSGKVDTDAFRNFDGSSMHFPGFHPEAVSMLMEETAATSLAVDTLSLDFGQSADFATHVAWLPSGRFGIECIANLDKVPAAGATVVIGAPKHRGGTGGPARILALA
jgi:kynurenine formamidase